MSISAHTVAVTTLSRDEVHGSTPRRAGAVAVATGAISATATVRALTDRRARMRDRLAAAALSVAYGCVVGNAQLQAANDPTAPTVRSATGRGIAGFPILQASWLARRGRLASAAAVVAGNPLVRYASRRMSTT